MIRSSNSHAYRVSLLGAVQGDCRHGVRDAKDQSFVFHASGVYPVKARLIQSPREV